MMLTDKSSEESRWGKWWNLTKNYFMDVGHVYLDFAGPLLLMIAANMAIDSQDKERFGLSWLYYTSLKSDQERETKFPPHEPSSAAQRRRVEAASAADAIASI
ncbi:unnamed protein product [Phytomonas sp. EM1]|nr:unnamed protein product [Phytomonas sp. EM1]|eukprot:CCW63569.1 unnamed protein product [Phytomonas sp. isolate EM1]